MENNNRPLPENDEQGNFVTVRDGLKIYVYEYFPKCDLRAQSILFQG